MGFNTVAVLYNDHHGDFERDGPLGKRIAAAMRGWTMRDHDRMAVWFGAGQVVSQAHADYSQVVVVSHNSGKPLADCNDLDWYALDQLKEALERHGYTVKKPKKRKASVENVPGTVGGG